MIDLNADLGEGSGPWRVPGHTTPTLWDTDRGPPSLLQPGTRVRFMPATAGDDSGGFGRAGTR